MRAGRFLLLFGITLIASSLTGISGFGTGARVNHGEYEGVVRKTIGSVIVEADEFRDRLFSLHVLTWAAFQGVLEDAVIEPDDTLITIAGIDAHLRTTIYLPGPGIYVFLVSSYLNESVNVDLMVRQSPPNTGLFIPGVGIASVGSVLVLISRYSQSLKK